MCYLQEFATWREYALVTRNKMGRCVRKEGGCNKKFSEHKGVKSSSKIFFETCAQRGGTIKHFLSTKVYNQAQNLLTLRVQRRDRLKNLSKHKGVQASKIISSRCARKIQIFHSLHSSRYYITYDLEKKIVWDSCSGAIFSLWRPSVENASGLRPEFVSNHLEPVPNLSRTCLKSVPKTISLPSEPVSNLS